MPVPGVLASSYYVASGSGNKAVSLSSGNKYSRSASGLNLVSTSLTWCCWVKFNANTGNYAEILATDDGGSNYVFFGTTSNGIQYSLTSTSGGATSAFNFTVGVWTFIAVSIDKTGANPWLYHVAAPGTSLAGGDFIYTLPTGFLDTNTFRIGDSGFNSPLNGSVAAIKIWNAALTQSELETELLKYAPQRTSGLWAAYKFDNGPQTTDDSGNGRTLTTVGTPTIDSSGPPCT